jgi:ABC-type nickel/cobalt efflux system permease component RcnA
MIGSLGGMLLGTLVGVRHAFEPDHLTAVSTMVADARDARRGALLGALWGVGHTISLVVVGTLVLATGTALPERAEAAFELAVAVMLIVLGVLALVRAAREGEHGPIHHHHHRGTAHTHAGPAAHVHVAGATLARRPLFIGLVHGLAGSGAMTALVFAELPDLASRIAYITLFGIGSIGGMALASAVAGASLYRFARHRRIQRAVGLGTGVLSIGVGVAWAFPQLAAL